jgi:hypothetical protein
MTMAEGRQGPANPAGEELALQVMAVIGGAGAVVALPLLAAAANDQAPVQVIALTFAFPLALVAVGRLRAQRHWQIAAGVLTVVIALLLTIRADITAMGAVLILAVGAPMSLVLVGRYLLEHDRLAGAAWLFCTSVAVIAGFLAIGARVGGVVGAILLLVFVGSAIALQRLRASGRDRE